jgi:hypothetical protein
VSVNHPPDGVGHPEGVEPLGVDDDKELQEAGPWGDEGSQERRRQVARSGDHSVRRWERKICSRGGGPRAASTSRRARSMLPEAQGAGAAACGDGKFRAPPRGGPLKVRALEVPAAARLASPCRGAPMRRGLPAPGVHWAGIFALLPLPGGRPRRFVPELGPAVAAELEGSMARRRRRRSGTGGRR